MPRTQVHLGLQLPKRCCRKYTIHALLHLSLPLARPGYSASGWSTERTLSEETQIDQKLADLANDINTQANEEVSEEQQDSSAARKKTKRAAWSMIAGPFEPETSGTKQLKRRRNTKFTTTKKLMYTVNVGSPDPQFGNMLLEQFGGANGELAAGCSTRFKAPIVMIQTAKTCSWTSERKN